MGVPHYHWIVFTIVLFLSILGTCCPTFFLYWVYHTTMKIAMNHYQSLVITITPRKNAIPKHQRTRLWRPWSILICAALRQGLKGCPCPQLGGVSMNHTCTIYIYVYICTHTHIKCIYIHTIYICIHNIYLLFVTLIQKQMANIFRYVHRYVPSGNQIWLAGKSPI